MKLLVLTVTAGEGHNAMGRALICEIEKRGYEAKMIDYHKGICPLRQWFSQPWYFWTLKNFPKFSHRSYEKLKNRKIKAKPPIFSAYGYMYRSIKSIHLIKKTIKEYKPDVIFSTHSYPAALISKWKKKGKINIPSFYLVSDYVVHVYSELANHNDYMITPNHDFDDELINTLGYKKEQLKDYGIPVNTKFSIVNDKKAVRKKLKLDENKTTILCISGAAGFGDTDEIVKSLMHLKDHIQVIIVNGKNEKMYEKIASIISKENLSNITNIGFANNVDELMDASDIMIGKVGGVGISEAFNKGLPIITIGEPPFQEYDNAVYLEKRNAIIRVKNDYDVGKAVEELVKDPAKHQTLIDSVNKLRKPNATIDIVNLMEKITK